jgi:hypothetical protein
MIEPLYQVQARALKDPAAAEEAARRYAALVTPTYGSYGDTYSARFLKRLIAAYLSGLRGEPHRARSYSNFERPLERAWRDGRELRNLLLKEKP